MQANFTYRLGRDEYSTGLTALTAELAKLDTAAPRRAITRLAVIVAITLPITYFFPGFFGGLLLLVVLFALAEAILRPRWARSARGLSYDPAAASLSLRIDGSGIEEAAEGRTRRWDWTAVRHVREQEELLIIGLVGWDMIVLPRRLWPDDEARQCFLHELEAYLPEAAKPSRAAPPSPGVGWNEIFALASVAAAVDLLFLLSHLLPRSVEQLGWLVTHLGFVGSLALLLVAAFLFSYPVYRLAGAGLRHVHERSPARARLLAQALIWMIPALTVAGSLELG